MVIDFELDDAIEVIVNALDQLETRMHKHDYRELLETVEEDVQRRAKAWDTVRAI